MKLIFGPWTVKITLGQIRVASISALYATPQLAMFEVELHSKYPEVSTTMNFEPYPSAGAHTGAGKFTECLYLAAGENTLRVHPRRKTTTSLEFSCAGNEGPSYMGPSYMPFHSAGRYTVQFALLKIPEKSPDHRQVEPVLVPKRAMPKRKRRK